ncbi:MAG: diaminopimelate epimerase, partial [Elusimicrobiota bacterium]
MGKAGANIDFIRLERGVLRLRTYERGVEAETLACGTGAVAAAAAAWFWTRRRPPVRVAVRGGAVLSVSFRPEA